MRSCPNRALAHSVSSAGGYHRAITGKNPFDILPSADAQSTLYALAAQLHLVNTRPEKDHATVRNGTTAANSETDTIGRWRKNNQMDSRLKLLTGWFDDEQR